MPTEPGSERDFAGVLALLRAYYEGLWNCDIPLLQSLFSPRARYATPRDGSVLELDMDEYLPELAQRTPPAQSGTPYGYAVDSVDFAGPDTALARLSSSMFGYDYTDFLSLVRANGRWRIEAKVFHGEPRPTDEEA